MFISQSTALRSACLASIILTYVAERSCAQYTVTNGTTLNFAGLAGDPNNTTVTGPVYSGPSTIFSTLQLTGKLFADGGTDLATAVYNHLRINGEADWSLCCSFNATPTTGEDVDASSLGYFFFDAGDQISAEAWHNLTPPKGTPDTGPVKSRIENFVFEYSGETAAEDLPDLGTFSPGSFSFQTVATVDEADPFASDFDVNSAIAIYTAADHTPIAVASFGAGLYRQVSASLGVGEYYLAVGRTRTTFTADAIRTTTIAAGDGGGNFNVALNGDALISGTLDQLDTYTYAPQLFTFTVTAPLLGDFNGDGVVNLADYTMWRDNLGGSDTALSPGSTEDGSGVVDAGDYLSWKSSFGNSGNSAIAASEALAVPEPASMIVGLLAVGLFGARAVGRRTLPRLIR